MASTVVSGIGGKPHGAERRAQFFRNSIQDPAVKWCNGRLCCFVMRLTRIPVQVTRYRSTIAFTLRSRRQMQGYVSSNC